MSVCQSSKLSKYVSLDKTQHRLYVSLCHGVCSLSVAMVNLLVPVTPGSPRWTVMPTWPSVFQRWMWTWPGEPTGCYAGCCPGATRQPRCPTHSRIILHGGHTQRAARTGNTHCSVRSWHLTDYTLKEALLVGKDIISFDNITQYALWTLWSQ